MSNNDNATSSAEENELSTPKAKQRKKKRVKLLDPNAPKRPANAFILFCELQRECIKVERALVHAKSPGSESDILLSNLTKALGTRWRELSEEERKVYQDTFQEQVKQYQTDFADYMNAHPNAPHHDAELSNLPKDWTDPNAPKRPANAFILFCDMEDQRIKATAQIEMNDVDAAAEILRVSKSLAQRWMDLSDNERQSMIC